MSRIHQRRVGRDVLPDGFFFHISKGRMENIKDASDPAKTAKAVFEFLVADGDFWEKSGPLPREIDVELFNKSFSSPSFKKIKSYFNRFAFQEYANQLARNLTRDFQPVTNAVDHLVDTRNQIAHGDPRATKTPNEVKVLAQTVVKFCRATDDVFGAWCSSQYCSIR